jgi:Trk K+ transport system NAD-binding subunit
MALDGVAKARIIVCGLNRTGYKILCLLKQQGASVIGVHDRRPTDAQDRDLDGIIIGDLLSAATLIAAGISEAHTLVLSGADEAINLAILMQARALNPRIRIVNRLFNASLGERLDRTLPEHFTMSVAALAAPVFAFTALGNKAIGQLRLFHQTWPIYEEYIDERHPWRGHTLAELWADRSRMLIYYLPIDGNMDLVSAVSTEQKLRLGDRLLVGTQPKVRTVQKKLNQKLGKVVASLRQLKEYSNSMLVVALALLSTIFMATLVYTSLQIHVSPIDALYFSVGMITGAGGNEQVVEKSSDGIKIFTVVMMLTGAAVIGIWYALLNDFVLGTRFRQFWDAARVPQRNHYVICGLGNVGVQIASQLHKYGHEVVAIERDPNNRFLETVRSLGIPVIQSDASLPATLRSANLAQADGLISVTRSDTANLEIALNAKGVAPKVPVILRYEDPHFAHMAQQLFEFESVLSPTEIVSPAFAAAALGGRIIGNGILGDKLWVSLANTIAVNHPFCGKQVKEAAMASDFVPLYIETESGTIHGWDLLAAHLSAGDVLYLTIPANKLDRLWRADPQQVISKNTKASTIE